ncbi:MAG: hypothetical protein JSV75_01835 [Candidatus Bathyarchaeota archaeon]|nr:MAG: hypothetical protein JSV75_01835 [Candidatus Bathyarchaeota archaeon]
MVKTRSFLVTSFVLFILLTFAGTVTAQREYHLEHEWAKIWINQNGTIDLLYDISITLESGPNINFVYIGQPKRDFTMGAAMDQYGHTLVPTDASSGSDYRVQVNLYEPLIAGQTIRFNLTTNVARMIYEDTQTNVGMKFTPTWWEEARVLDLQVQIVLPPGVTADNVTTTEELWDGTPLEEGQLSVFWQREDLSPNQKYTFGVSFPKEYVQSYEKRPTGLVAFLQQYGPALLIFGVAVVAIAAVVFVVRKRPYLVPKISTETLGIRRGLTAVEASYLLEMKPTKIVTEILYSLLQKRAIWVESTTPVLKLKIMKSSRNKTETQETPLRYYEIDFVNSIKEDGTLDEEKLAETVVFLRHTVEEKLRGYCRRDSIDYYKRIVAKAWEQVEQVGTPELASKAYDEQLLWLFLDPNYQSRTRTTFRDKAFEPSPFWLWYWYGYRHYSSKPTYKPNIGAPTKAAKPPTIPGADFANNIATAVEGTSNKIVSNLEKFANAIVPTPSAAKASTQPAHHKSSCVCACASCACVCACVSCACACASGGVG